MSVLRSTINLCYGYMFVVYSNHVVVVVAIIIMIDINFGHVLQMFSFDDHEFNHVLVARSIAI